MERKGKPWKGFEKQYVGDLLDTNATMPVPLGTMLSSSYPPAV